MLEAGAPVDEKDERESLQLSNYLLGVGYVEEGDYYREDEIRIKLLRYITQSNDIRDKE